MFSSICLVMLLPLLFLFLLILLKALLYRSLQEEELSKQDFYLGRIWIFSYFVSNQIKANFMGRKHPKNCIWEKQRCFLSMWSRNSQDLLWDSAEEMPSCMITKEFIPRSQSNELVVQIKQIQNNLFYFSSLSARSLQV